MLEGSGGSSEPQTSPIRVVRAKTKTEVCGPEHSANSKSVNELIELLLPVIRYLKYVWLCISLDEVVIERRISTDHCRGLLSSASLEIVKELFPCWKCFPVHDQAVRQSTLPSERGHHATSAPTYLHFHWRAPLSSLWVPRWTATMLLRWLMRVYLFNLTLD